MTDKELKKLKDDLWHAADMLRAGAHIAANKYEQPKSKVKSTIEMLLNEDLPDSYDKDSFQSKIDLLMNHFVDMAVQGYGWINEAA